MRFYSTVLRKIIPNISTATCNRKQASQVDTALSMIPRRFKRNAVDASPSKELLIFAGRLF